MSSYTSSARLARDTRSDQSGASKPPPFRSTMPWSSARRKARSSGWTFFFRYCTAASPMFWARKNIGEDAVQYLKNNVHPLDLAFRLAEDHGIVLLNGGGFEAPDWSLRVSLANLADDVYDDIGRGVRTVARGYRDAFEASKRAKRE